MPQRMVPSIRAWLGQLSPAWLGLSGCALLFASLVFLGGIGAGAKSPLAMGLQILLLWIGPLWASVVIVWAGAEAWRRRRWLVLVRPAATGGGLLALWLGLKESHALGKADIRAGQARMAERVFFPAIVESVADIATSSASLVASERDSRVVLTLVLHAESVPARFKSGQRINVAVHSVERTFGSAQNDVVGRSYGFALDVVKDGASPVYELVATGF
jgi:hypothetical protein